MAGTLALTLGTPAGFGAFVPGVAATYAASIDGHRRLLGRQRDAGRSRTRARPRRASSSTARSRCRRPCRRSDQRGGTSAGAGLAVGGSAAPTALLNYAAPVSNDAVTVGFKQPIAATDAAPHRAVREDADADALDDRALAG